MELEGEKQKTEDLLCELMPASVAESLRLGNTVEAREFQEVTILFTDIGIISHSNLMLFSHVHEHLCALHGIRRCQSFE